MAAVLLTGCASIEPAAQGLPAASELVATSGAALRSVLSGHFSMDVHGTVPGEPIRKAEGDVDARGTAKGSADIVRSGELAKVKFALVKGTFYVTGPTGAYQKVAPADAGRLFGLTSILNPNHGMARMVVGVNSATTQDREKVNGVECFRITGRAAPSNVAAVVPGIGSEVDTTVWLTVSGAHLPVRAEFTVRGPQGQQRGTVDVTLSDVNTPISVDPPV